MSLMLLPVTRNDYEEKALRLRDDIRECDHIEWLLGAPTVGGFVKQCVNGMNAGGDTWELVSEGRSRYPLALFGSHPMTPNGFGLGVAWFVGTNALMAHTHEAHRLFTVGLSNIVRPYDMILASSWSGNIVHHEWMTRMGFERIGAYGLLSSKFFNYRYRNPARSRSCVDH